ncbi:hypothetical protein AYO44_03915 [Planctomycetaceae bacterium SCGC AG-212-F19]|nr:hypothetical protein AYO44_03915 [Planctomycetaceae bacterium SCGC AG-212-F19]
MTRLLRIAVGVLLVTLPASASANWFRSRPAVAVASYYCPPLVCVPSYLVVCPIPMTAPLVPAVATTAEPPRIYATPVPAPASSAPGTAPPANPAPSGPTPKPPPPGANEAQSYYDAYAAAAPRTGLKPAEVLSIGFWNNTSKSMMLRVQGQSHALPAGRGVTLELPRQFVWQIDGRDAQLVNLPAAQTGADFVIRR